MVQCCCVFKCLFSQSSLQFYCQFNCIAVQKLRDIHIYGGICRNTLWQKADVATLAIAAASCALMSGLNKSDCMIMLWCAKHSTGGYAGAFILPEVIASQPKKQPPGLKNEPHMHNNCSSAIGHFRLALKTSKLQ